MGQPVYGNNRVFLGGLLIGGPDVRSSFASVLMIFVPSVLWHVEVGVFFTARYSSVVLVIFGYLQVSSMALLLATAFSDPGILPRQKNYTDHYEEKTQSYRQRQPPRYYDVLVRGHPFRLKYCVTCNIYRPPRTTHCSVCENCIERFDHHCPWIGNCVGKRNYRLFYAFVSTTGLLNVLVLVSSAMQIWFLFEEFKDEDGRPGGEAILEAIKKAPIATALCVYCLAIVWFTMGLCMYHNFLIATNQTTYEQIKGAYGGFGSGTNPFHRGILGNYRDILCGAVRKRYFDADTGQMRWPSVAPTVVGAPKPNSAASDVLSERLPVEADRGQRQFAGDGQRSFPSSAVPSEKLGAASEKYVERH